MKEQDIITYFQEQEAQQKVTEEKKAKEATAKIRKETKKRPPTEIEGIGTVSLDSNDPMYFSLNSLLEIPDADKSNSETQDKLKEIYNWAKEKSGSNDLIGIKLEIRRLQNKLGKADANYNKVYQFVRLSREQNLLKEEMKLLKG